jgi:hypothetical protein
VLRILRARSPRACGLLIACAATLASVVEPGFAQSASNEAAVKAAFVYNFLKFVDWPPRSVPRADQPLTVAIVGEGPVADATANLLQGKRVSVHPLLVVRVKRGEPVSEVHAVFITGADHKEAHRTLASMTSGAVLTISDDPHFASRGGMIGLYVEDRRVRFEVNTDAADARGLRVSSRLLALARLVRSGANGEGARP